MSARWDMICIKSGVGNRDCCKKAIMEKILTDLEVSIANVRTGV
jgi:hypothetical protein